MNNDIANERIRGLAGLRGGSRGDGPIMGHIACRCGAQPVLVDGVWQCPNESRFPGGENDQRQRESSRSDLLDGDDSGLHGADRERAVARAVELAVLAEQMRGALANIRVYLTEMELENDRLRKAAEKWSEL